MKEHREAMLIADKRIKELAITQKALELAREYEKQICNEVLLIIDEKFNCCGYVEEKFDDIKKYVLEKMQGEQ